MPEPTPEAWAQIRYDYEHTNRPVDDICLEHGTTANTLRHRARRWGWKMRRAPIPAEGPPAVAGPAIETIAPDPWPLGPCLRGDERSGDRPRHEEQLKSEVTPTPTLPLAGGGSTGDAALAAEESRDGEPSPHLLPIAPPQPGDSASIGARLQSAVGQVLPALEATLARLAGGPMQPRQMEQVARALGSLTRTLRELNGLLVQYGAQEPERDIEEIRTSLSRKLEALVAEQEAENAEQEA